MTGIRYILAIAALALACGTLPTACSRGGKVKIAVMTRLQSGSTVGSSQVNATKLFLEERGVRNIEIVPFNDDWEPKRAVEAYTEMRAQGLRALLITSQRFHLCALALRESINRDRVLTMVTGSATDDSRGSRDYIFRNVQDVRTEQKSIAEYVNGLPEAHFSLSAIPTTMHTRRRP